MQRPDSWGHSGGCVSEGLGKVSPRADRIQNLQSFAETFCSFGDVKRRVQILKLQR